MSAPAGARLHALPGVLDPDIAAPYTGIPAAELRPAPMPGEQTRQICREVLGLTADEAERLIANGVLFTQQGSP